MFKKFDTYLEMRDALFESISNLVFFVASNMDEDDLGCLAERLSDLSNSCYSFDFEDEE